MKFFFKNVGQGDSIVVEWLDAQGEAQIGFIDCCLYKGKNPSLEHLIYSSYERINFIVLSHAHEDHFSGMLGLLEHCKRKSIKIKSFYHSLIIQHLSILQRRSIGEAVILSDLLEDIINLVEEGFIEDAASPITEHLRELSLDQDTTLWFLAPHHKNYTNLTKEEKSI